jgi:general L-amino acid transport system substrate-binding protein|uniref:Amino acid ABC transporter substrate-binding protein n=1 Tax=Acidicaldus sp. TaxID=1872105 RepID=A0A8J4HD09_9PROT
MPPFARSLSGLAAFLALLLPSLARAAPPAASPTLAAVLARGVLNCGVAGNAAGFSLPDSAGVMRGIDADGCRAIAAAVLGDQKKLKFVPTTTENRFTALQSGEIDVLVRETTWTLGREASLGLEFGVINFYDGTGFMVKKSSGVTSARDLDGATICVEPGTSTELAIADYFRVNAMKYTPVEIQDLQEIHNAFLSGRCDAYSTDSSALAGFRFTQGAHAEDFVLLPELISKEPLGPMVRKGDDKWFDIIRWVSFAEITAEELGVSSRNVESFHDTTNPDIRRLLGLEGDLGKALGLDDQWAFNVIRQVGNTGEIWQRNMAPLGLPRGLNNLWNRGGLLFAPPLR